MKKPSKCPTRRYLLLACLRRCVITINAVYFTHVVVNERPVIRENGGEYNIKRLALKPILMIIVLVIDSVVAFMVITEKTGKYSCGFA